MKILELNFSSFWRFLGTAILLYMICETIGGVAVAFFNRNKK